MASSLNPRKYSNENINMKNSVNGFVQQRIDELNEENYESHKASEKISVTLRLLPSEVALADRICEELSLSRQAFLSGIIYGGMIDACNTLSDLQPAKKQESYYKQLIGMGTGAK